MAGCGFLGSLHEISFVGLSNTALKSFGVPRLGQPLFLLTDHQVLPQAGLTAALSPLLSLAGLLAAPLKVFCRLSGSFVRCCNVALLEVWMRLCCYRIRSNQTCV